MIEIVNLSSEKIDERLLKKAAEVVLKEEKGLGKGDLSVALVGKEEIRNLNREKKGRDEPTDVLSFDLEPSKKLPRKIGGQVVVCPEVVKERFDQDFERALALVLVHGILHILGYNHKREEEEKAMKEKEDYYLSKIF